MKHAIFSLLHADDADPITSLLTRDWAAVGGWSLFLGLVILIVIGSFREWWVPGVRYRRLESSAALQSTTLSETVKQNGQLITSNEITKHFFEETTPKRGETIT